MQKPSHLRRVDRSSLAVTRPGCGLIVGLVDAKSIVTSTRWSARCLKSTSRARLRSRHRRAPGRWDGLRVASDGNIVTIDVKSGQATMKSKLSEMLKAGVTVTVDFNPVRPHALDGLRRAPACASTSTTAR